MEQEQAARWSHRAHVVYNRSLFGDLKVMLEFIFRLRSSLTVAIGMGVLVVLPLTGQTGGGLEASQAYRHTLEQCQNDDKLRNYYDCPCIAGNLPVVVERLLENAESAVADRKKNIRHFEETGLMFRETGQALAQREAAVEWLKSYDGSALEGKEIYEQPNFKFIQMETASNCKSREATIAYQKSTCRPSKRYDCECFAREWAEQWMSRDLDLNARTKSAFFGAALRKCDLRR